jgi:hypothetical protein
MACLVVADFIAIVPEVSLKLEYSGRLVDLLSLILAVLENKSESLLSLFRKLSL